MNADQHRKAKYVIAWLAKAEDPDNPDFPIARIKAERWTEVCEAVVADPDLSAATIAERLGVSSRGGAGNRKEPGVEGSDLRRGTTPATDAGHVLTRNEVRDRLATARAALSATTKPPIGDTA